MYADVYRLSPESVYMFLVTNSDCDGQSKKYISGDHGVQSCTPLITDCLQKVYILVTNSNRDVRHRMQLVIN